MLGDHAHLRSPSMPFSERIAYRMPVMLRTCCGCGATLVDPVRERWPRGTQLCPSMCDRALVMQHRDDRDENPMEGP
jgi:hypothetical protein